MSPGLCLLALALLADPTSPAPAAPDPTLGFGLYLLERGDYYRAIGELERFRYQNPSSPAAFAAGLTIGRAYELGGKPVEAAAWLDSLSNEALTPQLEADRVVELAYASYLQGPLGEPRALDTLNRFFGDRALVGSASRDTRDRAQYLMGWAFLESGDTRSAAQELRVVDLPWAGRLADEVDARADLPHKSPAIAGVLSAVIPGLGHLYLGQPLIGAAAFGWNGLFTAAAVDSAVHKLYGVTAVLGGLELLWYGGAVLGAVSGAYKYNRDAELNHLDEVKRTYDPAPASWPPNPPQPAAPRAPPAKG